MPKEATCWGAVFSLPFPDDQFPDQRIEGYFSRIEKFGGSTAGTAFLEPSGDFQRAGECVVGNVEFYRTDETGRSVGECWLMFARRWGAPRSVLRPSNYQHSKH